MKEEKKENDFSRHDKKNILNLKSDNEISRDEH